MRSEAFGVINLINSGVSSKKVDVFFAFRVPNCWAISAREHNRDWMVTTIIFDTKKLTDQRFATKVSKQTYKPSGLGLA